VGLGGRSDRSSRTVSPRARSSAPNRRDIPPRGRTYLQIAPALYIYTRARAHTDTYTRTHIYTHAHTHVSRSFETTNFRRVLTAA